MQENLALAQKSPEDFISTRRLHARSRGSDHERSTIFTVCVRDRIASRCDVVVLWDCTIVVLWRCGVVVLWCCSLVALWNCIILEL